MPVQTAYSATHDAAFPGQRVNLGLIDIDSKTVETAAGIAAGLAVVAGSADKGCKSPTAAAQRVVGITEHTSAGLVAADGSHDYEQYEEANVITFGKVWVEVEEAVVAGDPVFFRHTAGAGETLGALRKSGDGGDCDIIPGAIFRTAADAGGLAIVDLPKLTYGLLPVETLTAVTSAVSVSTKLSLVDTTLGAMAASLADGYEGQEKTIKLSVDGGNLVVTPANFNDGTTMTFADAGDMVNLMFVDGGWELTNNVGGVVVA